MIHPVLAAVIGFILAGLLTFGLARLQPRSGDQTIQPEGEPDPGKRD